MTTDPGDLVIDPTCGSGTTAYVAEQWGRRWITIDTSRVPLALARERLITATYPWYSLRDALAGPAGGFQYSRHRNRRGEEDGGIVPHITSSNIANDEPPAEEVMVDRPDKDDAITRISGPFVVEATLPMPQQPADSTTTAVTHDEPGDHVARMIEVLRRSPTIALPGNRKVTLKSTRRPGRSLSLSAEAQVGLDAAGNTVSLKAAIDAAHETNTDGLPFSSRSVAILFGPADGPVSSKADRRAPSWPAPNGTNTFSPSSASLAAFYIAPRPQDCGTRPARSPYSSPTSPCRPRSAPKPYASTGA